MALVYPGPSNVFVPSHKATAGLMTGFSRSPSSFPLNRYAQIQPVDKPIGLYATWNSKQAARIQSSNLSEWMWPDGQDAATGADNLEAFAYKQFRTYRYNFPFLLGDMTVKNADWNILQAHSEMAAQQCMTAREYLSYGVWGTATNWDTHCANVDGTGGTLNGNAALNANGVNWTTGTETNPTIKKNFNTVRIAINKDTLGVIQLNDIIVVMNPNTASAMSTSQEVHSYLARNQNSLDQLRGGKPGQNMLYGLPDQMYGSEIVVDDTVLNTTEKGIDTLGYMIADGDVLFATRKGGLEGIGGGPAHSTIMIFYYQDDMTVESYHDVNNRLTRGRVVSNFTTLISTNVSGFYLKRAIG